MTISWSNCKNPGRPDRRLARQLEAGSGCMKAGVVIPVDSLAGVSGQVGFGMYRLFAIFPLLGAGDPIRWIRPIGVATDQMPHGLFRTGHHMCLEEVAPGCLHWPVCLPCVVHPVERSHGIHRDQSLHGSTRPPEVETDELPVQGQDEPHGQEGSKTARRRGAETRYPVSAASRTRACGFRPGRTWDLGGNHLGDAAMLFRHPTHHGPTTWGWRRSHDEPTAHRSPPATGSFGGGRNTGRQAGCRS